MSKKFALHPAVTLRAEVELGDSNAPIIGDAHARGIALARGVTVELRSLEDGEPLALKGPLTAAPKHGFTDDLRFSPDGRRLARFSTEDVEGADGFVADWRTATVDLFELSSAGATKLVSTARLERHAMVSHAGVGRAPTLVFAPDGEVLVRSSDEEIGSRVFRVEPASGRVREVRPLASKARLFALAASGERLFAQFEGEDVLVVLDREGKVVERVKDTRGDALVLSGDALWVVGATWGFKLALDKGDRETAQLGVAHFEARRKLLLARGRSAWNQKFLKAAVAGQPPQPKGVSVFRSPGPAHFAAAAAWNDGVLFCDGAQVGWLHERDGALQVATLIDDLSVAVEKARLADLRVWGDRLVLFWRPTWNKRPLSMSLFDLDPAAALTAPVEKKKRR